MNPVSAVSVPPVPGSAEQGGGSSLTRQGSIAGPVPLEARPARALIILSFSSGEIAFHGGCLDGICYISRSDLLRPDG